jgi:menaquinone-dependent protoporphyrinogen oxidase
MRVLIAAASRHEATTEIAQAIGRALTQAGIEVEVSSPTRVESLDGYDGVVLGSAVYMGRWQPSAVGFIEAHAEALRTRPVWLFSSGPIGSPDPKPEGDPAEVSELAREIGAREHHIFTGRLDRGRLGFGERAIVAAVKAEYGDFRNWDEIAAWGAKIARQLAKQPVSSAG